MRWHVSRLPDPLVDRLLKLMVAGLLLLLHLLFGMHFHSNLDLVISFLFFKSKLKTWLFKIGYEVV